MRIGSGPTCARRREALVVVVCLLGMPVSGACGFSTPERKGSGAVQRFTVNDQTVTIDDSGLEQIRTAVVEHLRKRDDDIGKQLAEELQGAIAVVSPDDSRLGQWALTEYDKGLALVRIPPRSAVNYRFVAKLDRQDGRWTVTDFHQERMMAR
jgi:hypothetical protein